MQKIGGKSISTKNIKSFHYNKPSHMKKECKTWKGEQNKGNKDEKETNKVTIDSYVIIVCDDICLNFVCKDSDWMINFGVSFHVTPYGDFFTS